MLAFPPISGQSVIKIRRFSRYRYTVFATITITMIASALDFTVNPDSRG